MVVWLQNGTTKGSLEMVHARIMLIDECQSDEPILWEEEFDSVEELNYWMDEYKAHLIACDPTPFTLLVEGFVK